MPSYAGRQPVQQYVTFRDHSALVDPPKATASNKKRPRDTLEVDLPNPELLRLHAALTRVMHLSGAAEIFPEPLSTGSLSSTRRNDVILCE